MTLLLVSGVLCVQQGSVDFAVVKTWTRANLLYAYWHQFSITSANT